MSVSPKGAILFVALTVAPVAYAQTGSIQALVTDPGGSPLPGATVSLTNSQGLVGPSAMVTDAKGIADFPVLRTGPGYSIQVQFPGYEPWSSGELRVSTDRTTDVSVRLRIGIHEEVSVRADRGIVDLDTTTGATHFTDEFLAELPVQSRFYQNVLTLAPGAVDPDQDGNPNIHGARARDVRILLGGVANVDPLTGQWMSYVNSDSIEELEVITTGAGVEWGRAQGGWGRILQKQGTNDFEGALGFLYRTSKLDGSGAAAVEDVDVPEFEATQPSIQFSGPIIKDRLWFRLSHERIHREDPVNAGGGPLAITTLEQTINSDQITWQASPRNKLTFHYDSDPRTIENAEITSAIPAESGQTWEFGGPSYRMTWTAAQSPRLLVGTEIGFQDQAVNILPSTPGVANRCVVNDFYPALDRAQCFYTNENRFNGSYYRTSRDTRQRLTVRTDVDWFAGKFAGSTHHVQYGFIIENERYARTLEVAPDMEFSWYKPPFSPAIGFATYRVPIPPRSAADVDGDVWGLYVEDQMKPAANLTITAGLRFDHEEIIGLGWKPFDPLAEYLAYRQRLGAGIQPALAVRESFTAYHDIQFFQDAMAEVLNVASASQLISAITLQGGFWPNKRKPTVLTINNANFAPRLAVAWDPASDGKTKLMLSAGRYYDKIFLAVPLIEQEPASTFMSFDTVRFRNLWYPFTNPEQAGTISQRTVDSDLRTPYQDELALSFERSISPETSVKVTLLHRAFEDQFQDEDINHVPGDFGRCVVDGFGRWSLDTRSGPDGILDDCLRGHDGIPDLYHLNPAWGEILNVANINTTEYRALVLELTRRMYRSWQLDASYTLSRAEGDAEDFDQILGNDRTQLDSERGVLSYDQTHVFKMSAAALLPHGIHLGGVARWESGLPYSVYASSITVWGVPPDLLGGTTRVNALVYPTGERNSERNGAFWTFDLRLAKEWNVGSKANAQLSVEVFNALNDDAMTIVDTTDGTPEWTRRFGRRWQLGARFAF